MAEKDKVQWAKLGDVCSFKKGQTITKANVAEGNVPVIAGGAPPHITMILPTEREKQSLSPVQEFMPVL